jgi:4-hydroxy-tetrahydrodipicolinate synthase
MAPQNLAKIITATGTPLDADERLHREGLELHLHDQWSAGIDGVLVAGSMGLMQMLRDETYRELVELAAKFCHGKGELLIGVGDASFARTRERIELACRSPVDGVVALPPYLFRFPQDQMVDYFRALADASRVPLYLYDLPVRTGVALDIETYELLAKHPNIVGAKVSGRLDVARQLLGRLPERFRIIAAEPQVLDVLLKEKFHGHLDGIFSVAPHWTVKIAQAAAADDWQRAAAYQSRLCALLELLRAQPSVMGAFTAMMNARGLPGRYHAAPFPTLDDAQREALLIAPAMQELLQVPSPIGIN